MGDIIHTERQGSAFYFEDYVIDKYNLKRQKYGALFDAYTKNNLPVSIKHVKKNSEVEFGDYFRQKSINEDFILVIDFYDEKNDDIIFLKITKEFYSSLFPNGFEEKFKSLLNNITNDYKDDKKWTEECLKLKNEYKVTSKIMLPRFKRDHKKQKRIQCAVSNANFFKYFVSSFRIKEIDGNY